MCIARAFVHASTDPIIGSEQKAGTYYQRTFEYLKANKPKETLLRSEYSIKTRVKDIKKQCVRFSACYERMEKMMRSGVNEDDEIRLNTTLVSKVKVDHPKEDFRHKFNYLKAWEILRDQVKFIEGGQIQTTTRGVPLVQSQNKGTGAGSTENSMGQKRAKELKIKKKQKNKKIRLAR